MVKYILAFLLGFFATAVITYGADNDRERRVKVALALNAAESTPVLEAAPTPRQKQWPSYTEAYKESINSGEVIVVYIGCDGAHPIDAIPNCIVATQSELAPYSKGTILIAYPFGKDVLEHGTLRCEQFAAVAKEADAARKKTQRAATGDKPISKPLNWDMGAVSATVKSDCCSYCTGECKCANKENCKYNNCAVATPVVVTVPEVAVPAQLPGYTLFKAADGSYFYQRTCTTGNCPLK